MVKMTLWFYATLLSFPRRKVAYEVKVISLHQGFVGNLFGFPVIYQEKIWGEWVQTRGYEACVFCMPIPLCVC